MEAKHEDFTFTIFSVVLVGVVTILAIGVYNAFSPSPTQSLNSAYQTSPGFTGQLKNALTGLWEFNDSGSVLSDYSGHNETGNILGGVSPLSAAQCQFSSCMSFDGKSGRITLGESVFPGDTVPASIFAWIYPTSNSSGNSVVFAYGGFSKADDSFGLGLNAQQVLTFFANSDSCSVPGLVISLDEWSFVGVTYSGSGHSVTLYSNGVGGTCSVQGDLAITKGEGYIGAWDGTSSFFTGRIAQLSIYNILVTGPEVQYLSQGNEA